MDITDFTEISFTIGGINSRQSFLVLLSIFVLVML